MTVTIIFKSGDASHKEQTFDVISWEVHNAYNFISLQFADGSTQQFNLNDVFAFRVDAVPAPPTKPSKK